MGNKHMSNITPEMIAELYVENHNLKRQFKAANDFVGQVARALQIDSEDSIVTYEALSNKLASALAGASQGVQEKQ